MYLQRLEDAKSSHTNWPTDCVEKPETLTLIFDEVDATLNSWKGAHEAFDRLQGDKVEPVGAAHRAFTQLCGQALGARHRGTSVYGTEIVAHALLKAWIADRQTELKIRQLDRAYRTASGLDPDHDEVM